MAEWNQNKVTADKKVQEAMKQSCGMYLASCLSDGEAGQLLKDWQKAGGAKKIPYWKFAFEHIQVCYPLI